MDKKKLIYIKLGMYLHNQTITSIGGLAKTPLKLKRW